jgi:NADH dehydrogenase/NADH:ubiquinone oxidoreductase subunit G
MNPYQQAVIDEAMRQINRQGQIAQQGLSAQAVRSGAFGGEREGVQRAELERGLMEQKASTIANLLNQGYSQAQANAMATFEQQQQRRMQAGQTVGQQAAQQAQLGQGAAGLYGNLAQQQVAAGQGLGQLGVQQAQLGQSAADIYNRSAQTYGNLAAQTAAIAAQESNMQQNIANLLAAQAAQRGQVASTAANIYGQQAGTFQNLGQGIGGLAAQQFGIGQNIASGLGALGGQLGQLGVQQAALGQTAQALNQGDINFLYNVGQAQQALAQQGIDAQRATQLQQIYAPYQQIGFLSDIYRGAPSTQMSTQVMSQPSASPFQQAVGIGLGAVSTLAGAKKAGII